MLRRLKNWVVSLFKGDTVVWEDVRGGVLHSYIIPATEKDWRARCTQYIGHDGAIIEYNVFGYGDYGPSADDVFLYLVEDTIHELTHWATDESDYSNRMSTHWKNWREVLYDEIEYVHGEAVKIRY